MSEVTRVPLQPIAKGSLTKFWLGLLAVIVIAAGVAWLVMPKGLSVTEVQAGAGGTPQEGQIVFVKYTGKLPDGTVFDQSPDIPLPAELQGVWPDGTPMSLDQVVPGFREGLMQMQKGGKYELFIPAEKGYGANPPPGSPIPPNSDLVFDVEVVDFMAEADVQRRYEAAQQIMQAQQPQIEGAAPAE